MHPAPCPIKVALFSTIQYVLSMLARIPSINPPSISATEGLYVLVQRILINNFFAGIQLLFHLGKPRLLSKHESNV